MMERYILYPSLQQPVLTDAQLPESVTEDRWHQPWSDPSGLINARKAAAFAIALIASGVSFDPNPLPATPQNIDQWGFAWSEPVRVKPRLQAASNDFHGFVQAAPFGESIDPGKWFAPLSEPVRVPPRLRAGAQPDLAIDAYVLTQPETVSLDKFLLPLAEPVRVKPALAAASQRADFVDPTALLLAETVNEARWHQPWSEPHANLAARQISRVLRVATQQVEPTNPLGVTEPERVSLDKFMLAWSEPVRVKRGLYARHHPDHTISPVAFTAPEPRIDKFLLAWSEPVRVKRGLRKEYQQVAALDPLPLTTRQPFSRAFAIY